MGTYYKQLENQGKVRKQWFLNTEQQSSQDYDLWGKKKKEKETW